MLLLSRILCRVCNSLRLDQVLNAWKIGLMFGNPCQMFGTGVACVDVKNKASPIGSWIECLEDWLNVW